MRKILTFILTICLCLVATGCNKATEPNDPSAMTSEPITRTALEIAQEYIENEQYEDAYDVLYHTANRSSEEESLLGRFSFVLVKAESESSQGSVSTSHYDLNGNLVRYENDKGSVYTYDYNSNGILIKKVIDSYNGDTETHEYKLDKDGKVLGLQVTSTSGFWLIDTYTYSGNTCVVESETKDGVEVISYEYDENGNVVKEIRADSLATWVFTYTYDFEGNLLKTVMSSGDDQYTTLYTYDSDGHMLTEVSDSAQTTYVYDENGNLTTKTYSYSSPWINTEEVTNYTYNFDEYKNIIQEIATTGDEITTTQNTYQLIFH